MSPSWLCLALGSGFRAGIIPGESSRAHRGVFMALVVIFVKVVMTWLRLPDL